MEVIINEVVDPEDLKKFEQQYIEQTKRGVASEKAQFEYAWCLIRSKHEMDMKKGVSLLEDLFRRTNDDTARRDHLFYMAIGYTKIKEYEDALKYTKAILKIEPTNHQALDLEKYIKNKMQKGSTDQIGNKDAHRTKERQKPLEGFELQHPEQHPA